MKNSTKTSTLSPDSATQVIEYSEQNKIIDKATFLAFVIMMIMLFSGIFAIVTNSTPDTEVVAKIYSSDISSEYETSSNMVMEDEPININTATLELLMQLNGIGETKANAIITYREENGPFEKVEDILNVSGIGDKTFALIKDKIKV